MNRKVDELTAWQMVFGLAAAILILWAMSEAVGREFDATDHPQPYYWLGGNQ